MRLYLVFSLDFIPIPLVFFAFIAPHEQIREDRATTDVTRQLVASSSGIRAQGCHGFDHPPNPPNFSLQFQKYQKYCPKLAADRSLDLVHLKWFGSIDLVPRVLIRVPSYFPALIWSNPPSICEFGPENPAADPHVEVDHPFRRRVWRQRN